MGTTGELVSVRRLSDLDTVSPPWRGQRGQVVLELAALDERERERWEQEINEVYRACGCKAGLWATIMAVVGYSSYVAFQGWYFWSMSLEAIVAGLAIVLAAALIGKALGLIYARLRLTRTKTSLRSRLGYLAAAEQVETAG